MKEEKQSKITAGIVIGSKTDAETMLAAESLLREFGVACEMRVLSAHRTPEHVVQWIRDAETRGARIFIAAAGLAAHLAGAVAANTLKPVIGVPMPGGPLNGFDALLATVQMPKGTPVATVAIGNAGAANAALLAVRILALSDTGLEQKLRAYQEKITAEVLSADQALRDRT